MTTRGKAAALAAGVVLATQLLAGVIRAVFPFGDNSQNVNDLWNQILPFHVQLGNVIKGSGASDWQYNWNTGLGVPWLPDHGTYVAGPTSLLVSLLPPELLDVGLMANNVTLMAAAAALMVCYLYRIRPGDTWWILGLLGAAYGICGWAVVDASYLPMWLTGLVALPALALAGEWARANEKFLFSVGIVALAWWSNYYTAYMASVGAALLLILSLLAAPNSLTQVFRSIVRFAVRGVLGVAVSAAMLLPIFRAIQVGAPGSTRSYEIPLDGFVFRLLPGTADLGVTPGFSLLSVALILGFTFPFSRHLSGRWRLTYGVGAAVVVASMAFEPTAIAWHAFTTPNGNLFRAAFVVCGLVVVLAWFAVPGSQSGSRPQAGTFVALALIVSLLAGAAILCPELLSPATYMSVAGLALAAILWRGLPPEVLRKQGNVISALIVLAVVIEGGVSSAMSLDLRDESLPPRQTSLLAKLVDALTSHEDDTQAWPRFRTVYRAGEGVSRQQNLGASANSPGAAYYSSLLPMDVRDAYRSLGGSFGSYGRSMNAPTDPFLQGLLGVSTVRTLTADGSDVVEHPTAFPVIRVAEPIDTVPAGPFAARTALLDDTVFSSPELTLVRGIEAVQLRAEAAIETESFALTGSCSPGSSLLLSEVPGTYSVALGGGSPTSLTSAGRPQNRSAGTLWFGQLEDGDFRLEFTEVRTARPSLGVVACADGEAFAAQAHAALTSAPDTSEVQGSRIAASWDSPVSGDVIIATLNTAGWACTADGSRVEVGRRGGLMSVRVEGASSVECQFRTPWLDRGLAISVVALLVIVGIAVSRRHRPAPRRGIR